uniref:Uncharacterized protein n=1 Tax=Candidatus Kentrum sp. TUN TaxID=2126343 RepID=A0A451A5H9_9GAMM|nr:MAG: hypothetical protein BECKTUN1418F_GA0071002_12521 [Candidatus Kentron sp. TUN]VFK70272.1 MAG: hypothetical protein BECKTUN1418E_GA0071001_12531 [Candidatus Kentron sp. TUN]
MALERLRQQVDIILVCHGLPLEGLPPADNMRVIDIPSAATVWQKERFYNTALSYLAREHARNYNYVIWADADILFSGSDWPARFRDSLQTCRLVQLFDRVEDVRIGQNGFEPTGLVRKSMIDSWESDIGPDEYFSTKGISLRAGCSPGFAWGARTSTIEAIGFPDFMILGGGDKLLLASGMGYADTFIQALPLNRSLSALGSRWGERVFRTIEGRVDRIENTIYHIVQGDYGDRRYAKRHHLIRDDRFIIGEYLEFNRHGAWEWYEPNNPYAHAIGGYFRERKD